MKRIRIYELYPTTGGYTVKSVAYRGLITACSAVSVRQALFFAYNDIWATNGDRPLGILWRYQRGREGGDLLLSSGSWIWGSGPHHGEGIKAIRRFMAREVA